MRVLLVSPLDPKVPGRLKYLVGGENTYSRTLLANPPVGVHYVHYSDALKNGQLGYLPLNKVLWWLVKLRILPLSSGSRCLMLKTNFDLVHCHSYSIKIDRKIPVILSDSSSNYLFLRDYVNWPDWRIRAGYFIRRTLFGLLGVIDCDTNSEGARKIVVFSDFARKLHEGLGVPKSKLVTIRPGLSGQKARRTEGRTQEVNLLFVGTWFKRKGGDLLLEAFERLSKRYLNVRLTIVGEIPGTFKVKSAKLKVRGYDFVPRERLMRDFFPKADIFILVPPKAEGLGFAVLEAMSFGIPVIVSDVCALPELVGDGKIGFVVKRGSVDELLEALEVLVKNRNLRERMGEAARKRFLEKFTAEKSNQKLLEVYFDAKVYAK